MVECLRGALVVMCAIGVAAAPDGFPTPVDNTLKTNPEFTDGVTLVKASEARSLNSDFGMLLLDGINSFVNTHRVGLAEPDVEGRGKNKLFKGGKKYMMPLILAIKAKMALLSGLVGHTIALIAAKAILVSKIALILGLLLFLKKLVTSPPKEVHHQHIRHRKIVLPTGDGDYHRRDSGWDKNEPEDDEESDNVHAHDMAYRRQRPKH